MDYYQQPDSSAFGILGFVYLAFVVFLIISIWKVYKKAGQPGWAAIVPFYNLYIYTKIIGRPGWWVILYLIPYLGIIFVFISAIDLAKSFGKSTSFGILALTIFGIIGFPILAFGKDKYVGPEALRIN